MSKWAWRSLALVFLLLSLYQSYDLGYTVARNKYDRELWDLKIQHQKELWEQYKKLKNLIQAKPMPIA